MRRLFFLVLLFIVATARGGETTAVVTGVVTHAGAPAPHVQVRSDESSTETNERGEYRLLVTPGRHVVVAGQASARFDIAAGETARFDLNLDVIKEFDLRQDFVDPEHAMADLPLTRDDFSHLPLGRMLDALPRLLPEGLHDYIDPSFIDGMEPQQYPARLPLDFFNAVNILTIGLPAEYGHTTSDLLLATTRSGRDAGGSAFAYWQPRSAATHDGGTSGTRHWDAGFAVGRPLTSRLWFFLGYSRLTDDFDASGLGTNRIHGSVDAFLGKLEVAATSSSTVTIEGFGDPGKTSYEFSGGHGWFRTGVATGVLRGTSNGSNWTAEGTVANTSMSDAFFNPHSTRINAGVQRMFASHVLRAGAEYDREPALPGFGGFQPPVLFHHNGTAAYLDDAWRATENLAIDAGLRGEFGGHDRLLPRASIAWMPRSDLRLFANYGQYGDDLLFDSIVIPLRMHEASAGAELRRHAIGLSARALHRTIDGQTLNGGLLEASKDLTPLRFRVSYLLSSFDRGYESIIIPRRHQVTGYASVVNHVTEFGTIVTWSSSAPLPPSNDRAPALFRTDVHLGVHLGRISVVADVMNVFDKQTPNNFIIFFPPTEGVHDQPLAWEAPRAIRFGIRAAL